MGSNVIQYNSHSVGGALSPSYRCVFSTSARKTRGKSLLHMRGYIGCSGHWAAAVTRQALYRHKQEHRCRITQKNALLNNRTSHPEARE